VSDSGLRFAQDADKARAGQRAVIVAAEIDGVATACNGHFAVIGFPGAVLRFAADREVRFPARSKFQHYIAGHIAIGAFEAARPACRSQYAEENQHRRKNGANAGLLLIHIPPLVIH